LFQFQGGKEKQWLGNQEERVLFKFCSPCQAELRGKWYSDYFNIWEEFFNDSFQLKLAPLKWWGCVYGSTSQASLEAQHFPLISYTIM
jgi:hypothetical protein